ncbi:hypothetical protein C8F04DRAFT_1074777 [Mycena alexandri]|uniref:DUF1275 domain protein n=1 Tax=Mycena alexandri TaxID=1745969 RepID=A0AAD6TBR4_9AGAR|nr:hypothetical protein C8F04DRAFT_1074777 [Mycena alexandri]
MFVHSVRVSMSAQPSATTLGDSKANLGLGNNKEVLPDPELGMAQHARPSFWRHLNSDVDPARSTGPLAAFCFMTGFIDAISFTAIFVWCGFQTGNFAQLALALARLWEPAASGSGRDTSFHIADKQALTSLISFNLGAFFGRVGDRIGPHRRIWLVLATLMQALLTMGAALAIWKSGEGSIAAFRGDPSWTNVRTFVGLALMSASLGVQGIVGKRLNTQFTTTIVLTTVWVELVTDPRLFKLRERVKTRDHKLIAALALFTGAFTARAILAQVGAPITLGVGAGLRLLIAISWIVIPGKDKVVAP